MLNGTFQAHPIKMGCCNSNENSLIVTTINPIWRSRPAKPWYKKINFCSLNSKENIIFAHIFILEKPVENLNQVRSDRRTVELRFSWEGVLNHTWISPWTQKGILLCEMDTRKRSVTYVFMNDETSV